jgi:hypothetical protein
MGWRRNDFNGMAAGRKELGKFAGRARTQTHGEIELYVENPRQFDRSRG